MIWTFSLYLSLSRSLARSFLFSFFREQSPPAPRRILRDTQQVIERRVRAHMQMTFVYMRNRTTRAHTIAHSPCWATTVKDPARSAHRTASSSEIRIGLCRPFAPWKKKHHRCSSRAMAASMMTMKVSLSLSLRLFAKGFTWNLHELLQ